MIATAKRLGDVQEYYFSKKLREIASLNQQGRDILNLGIGSPDRMPHDQVVSELSRQSENPSNHGYQSYKGIPELRQAFANWYKKFFEVTIDPETELLPLIGSKEGIFHISMTYLNEGDEVLVPNPGYPTYASASRLTGARIRNYDLTESQGWLPDLDALEKTDLTKVKIMWVNYPHMPTGTAAPVDLFRKLIGFAERNNILICNDNPYAFILNDHPRSIMSESRSPNLLELNSLSKSHNMAGWRIGVLAGEKQHIDNVLRFKSNLDSGMFRPAQLAATLALGLDESWYEELNKEYRERRTLAWQILDMLNCQYSKEQVGMFIWSRVPDGIDSVEQWIDEIMLGAEVFITPGFIFGTNGERFIRISLCSKKDVFEEAISRLKDYLA